MGVRRVEDLIAWQLAVEFKEEVYRLVRTHKQAQRDFQYRDQLFDAASGTQVNIVEGFYRFRPREFVRFLEIAYSCHAEAESWVRDGVARGHLSAADIAPALRLAKRCSMAILRLIQSKKRDLNKGE